MNNSSIKVFHISTMHLPDDMRIVRKECRSLIEAGYQVYWVGRPVTRERLSGLRYIPFKFGKSRWARFFLTSPKIFLFVALKRPAIVHFHEPEFMPWAFFLSFLKVKVIYDMHENLRVDFEKRFSRIPESLVTVFGRMYCLIERFFLRRMHIVFAEESYQKVYEFSSRTKIVRNFVRAEELSRIRASTGVLKKRERFTLVYLGGISRERGSITTLEAISLLSRRGLDVAVELVGPISDAHREELEAEVKRLGLDRWQVSMPGGVAPEIGWRIALECHVGLATLHPLGNYTESYPTKIFEYMALGVPILVSNFRLYEAVVDEYQCGYSVDPTDSVAIADKIEELFKNPGLRADFGSRGRRAVAEEFNWKTEERSLLDFYDEILL